MKPVKPNPYLVKTAAGVLSLFASAALLVACSGGGSSTSNDSNASNNNSTALASAASYASGIVTGFGSVFVDGVEIEDAQAAVRVENADGSYSNVALKLGQHVELAHDGKGVASSVTVNAAIVGAVNSLGTVGALGDLKAAGQWIKVNTDAAVGPITAYGGGYTALSDILANDLIEVHGSLVLASDGKTYVIQASRIEKKSSISAIRVMGKISNLDVAAKTFAINGITVQYTNATLTPSSATLANDQVVSIWAASSGGTSLNASRVRVLGGGKANNVTTGAAQIGGVVTAYNASANTLQIDGVTINVASATRQPTGAVINNGAYITVKGVLGTDGVLTASSVHVRQADTIDATARVQIKGVISSFVDASSFMVRGIPVDASGVTLDASCAGITLADGVYVEIQAAQQADTAVVKASSLVCKATKPNGTVIRDAKGTVSNVDSSALTFTLTKTDGSTQKVSWSAATAWDGTLSAASLSATTASVKVEGYLDANGVLVAREIEIQGTGDNHQFEVDKHHNENEVKTAWETYKKRAKK